MSAMKILEHLKEGNLRFLEQRPTAKKRRPSELAKGQKPHTVILACADSRVPPEILFDQDLGDLFVVRVAGNIATDEAIGSIEFAAANFGSSLVLVLGHTECGAVAAAEKHVKHGQALPSPCLHKVVAPLIAPVKQSKNLDEAIDKNIKATTEQLVEKSPILRDFKEKGKLSFVEAKYHLETGQVEFL